MNKDKIIKEQAEKILDLEHKLEIVLSKVLEMEKYVEDIMKLTNELKTN